MKAGYNRFIINKNSKQVIKELKMQLKEASIKVVEINKILSNLKSTLIAYHVYKENQDDFLVALGYSFSDEPICIFGDEVMNIPDFMLIEIFNGFKKMFKYGFHTCKNEVTKKLLDVNY